MKRWTVTIDVEVDDDLAADDANKVRLLNYLVAVVAQFAGRASVAAQLDVEEV